MFENLRTFFDPTGRVAPTYEDLQQRKKIAAMMMARAGKIPTTFGGGLQAIGEALGDRAYYNKTLEDEQGSRAYEAGKTGNIAEPEAPVVAPYAPAAAAPGPQASVAPAVTEVPPGPQAAAAPVEGFRPPPAYLAAALANSGLPPERQAYLGHLAGKEARSATEVSPTGAAGPFQFIRSTGRQYGLIGPEGDRRTDPAAAIAAVNRLTDDNAAVLEKALGRPPSPGELALAHQQGAGTAARMLTGAGNAPNYNLAVNNAGGLGPQAAASKIMAYYGMPGGSAGGGSRDTAAAILADRQRPLGGADVAENALLAEVTGISPQAERAAYAPTASLRTGNIMSDADPESPAMQSVVDTVQARRGGTVAPQAMQPPPPGPQVAQANVFPNPVVAADGRVAPIIPGGGLPTPPAPAVPISKAPEPPSAQIRSAPEAPQVKPMTPPTPPRLQPMVDDYIRQQATIANDPRLSDTTRAMALKQIEKRQTQIKAVNDQTLLEYNDYRKRYEDQQTPATVYGNEKLRRELEGEGAVPLTPEQRKQFAIPESQPAWLTRRGEIKLGPAGQTINVDTKGASEESKIRGKLAAERENEVIQAANKAGDDLTTIARAEELHKRITTGALEPGRTTIAALGKSMGVSPDALRSIGLKPEELGSRQAFNAIVNELTIGKIGPGGMPANNFSEGDRKFLTQTQISLGDDDESNRIKLAAARKTRELHMERADRWGDFREAHPDKSYADFERIWNKELKSRNEFGELNKRAEELLKGAQAIPDDLPTATTPINGVVSDGKAAYRRTKDGWERLR